MVVLDTNVLVDAVNGQSPFHWACRERVDRLHQGQMPWHTTWGVIYEFLRVATHPKVFPSPLKPAVAWSFIEGLFESATFSMLTPTPRHRSVARDVLKQIPELRGNLWHDAETAILMREHGIRRIYTRDTDFHRFPFLEVVDPTR
jgi:toxin-antitoxin system PIN domain toxin